MMIIVIKLNKFLAKKQYKFVVRANSIEDAENIISKRYEQGEDIQDKLDVFTFETLAAENNV